MKVLGIQRFFESIYQCVKVFNFCFWEYFMIMQREMYKIIWDFQFFLIIFMEIEIGNSLRIQERGKKLYSFIWLVF